MAGTKIMMAGARIWRAPVGTTDPLDTMAFGAAWPSPWVAAGYTNAPLSLSAKYDKKKVMVQQKRSSLITIVTNNEVTFGSTLVDWSKANFNFLLGGSTSVVAAGADQPGMDVFTFDTKLPPGTYKWGIEGQYVLADTGDNTEGTWWPVRILIPSGTAADGVETEIDKENESGIPFTIDVNEPANNIPFTIRWQTAAATS